jgi:soluble lytic murein transglycosylase-like protein
LKNTFTTRLARLRKRTNNSRAYRLLGARGAAALLVGAALSVGGLTQALDGAHFVVEKDLDSVRVVQQQGKEATVVANVHDGFAANSLFKLSRVFPGSLVSQRIDLFNDGWLPKPADPLAPFNAPHRKFDVFHREMARLNDAIRGQFFANAMPYGDLIHEKAIKYDVDPALVAAVIEQESKFHRTAHSPVGARGLMQLMPRTGRWLGARNLYDPAQNVDAGVKYIKYLQHRFDGNVKKTIAAYNAGEGNVKRYNGIPPFRETQTYVRKVMSNYQKRNEQLRDFSAEHAGVADDGVRTLR